ncbi:hypothetical protein [Xenorhabdus nematophila]|uniref:hypothetical protein n=1 Tax=Xenorhabdus nematophila TaxID=628 RepID=UPI0030D97B07
MPNSRKINGKSLANDVTLNAGDVGAYDREEVNQKFQPLGNYPPAGYSYSKEEANNRYQSKGNYAPTGNYAVRGECYTRGESDGRYQSRGNYQPAGNYAVRGECYTRGESDNRYLQSNAGTRRTQEKVVWTGRVQDRGTMDCTESIAGCLVYVGVKNGQYLPLEVPVYRRVFSTQWPGSWWGRIEFIPPSTLVWQDGSQIMNQVVLSK